MTICLKRDGYDVNRKRVMRLMRKMGLAGQTPGPNTSKPHSEHKVYPYLLKGMDIGAVNQVWSPDITYIPMKRGLMYLTAVIDWYSRYVLSWELSNTLESVFCVRALQSALGRGKPEIFNTDQGSQFTSTAFTNMLESRSIRISMDGRGHWRTMSWLKGSGVH